VCVGQFEADTWAVRDEQYAMPYHKLFPPRWVPINDSYNPLKVRRLVDLAYNDLVVIHA
jgi:hypothetical protein